MAKFDSIGISDPLDCEKSLCISLMFFGEKNLEKIFFSPFAPKLIPTRRVCKRSLELRVPGKIRSVLLSEGSFSGKCALKCVTKNGPKWQKSAV